MGRSLELSRWSSARHLCLGLMLFLAAATIQSAPVVSRTVNDFEIGAWSGVAHFNDDTNQFSSCSATAGYRSGTDMTVFVGRDYGWAILFWNAAWNFRKADGDVRIKYNSGTWLSVPAVYEDKTIFLRMPSSSTDVELFSGSSVLDISAAGVKQGFNLTGTRRVIEKLSDCVSGQLAAEGGTESAPSPVVSAPVEPQPARSSGGSGTGFIVSKEGHIVTNQHVVAGCSKLAVIRSGEASSPALLLRVDEINDLAVLKQADPLPNVTPATLRITKVRVGESVAVFGFPLRGTLSASGNITSGNVSSLAGLADDVRQFQISAPIQPGNSGGPLLDMMGNVIGVTNAKLNEIKSAQETGTLPQNVNFAIKSNVLANFLDAHSVNYQLADGSKPTLSLPDIAEAAKSFTVQVLCD